MQPPSFYMFAPISPLNMLNNSQNFTFSSFDIDLVVGLGTTYGANKMMMTTFIATIAFSIGLLAFCAGAWLTIWATSSSQVSDVAAAKLTGYFVTILALVALVFTSYYIAMGVLSSGSNKQPQKWSKMKKTGHPRNTPRTQH